VCKKTDKRRGIAVFLCAFVSHVTCIAPISEIKGRNGEQPRHPCERWAAGGPQHCNSGGGGAFLVLTKKQCTALVVAACECHCSERVAPSRLLGCCLGMLPAFDARFLTPNATATTFYAHCRCCRFHSRFLNVIVWF
jgi:hypothetical protein